jgi:hypothetical protein
MFRHGLFFFWICLKIRRFHFFLTGFHRGLHFFQASLRYDYPPFLMGFQSDSHPFYDSCQRMEIRHV